MIPKAQEKKKQKKEKFDYIKPKSFCTAKQIIKDNLKNGGEKKEWEKIFANYVSDKALILDM
jgi:hypothetical protein